MKGYVPLLYFRRRHQEGICGGQGVLARPGQRGNNVIVTQEIIQDVFDQPCRPSCIWRK